MASYVGNSPDLIVQARQTSYRFVATAGQSNFTGADSNGLPLVVDLHNTQVYLNGVLLDQTDYELTAIQVHLLSGATVNDIVEVITAPSFYTSDMYNKSEVDQKITNVIGSAGAALDTLGELSDALGDDANFASTVTTSLAGKVSKTSSTGSVNIPVGSTAQRDGTPSQGYFRFNNSTNQFEGYNGTAWGAVGGGATGGANNPVFYENDQTISVNYSITTGKNAMTAGPITIADGVDVTIPDGSTWTIV
jgi:hypothetical protein